LGISPGYYASMASDNYLFWQGAPWVVSFQMDQYIPNNATNNGNYGLINLPGGSSMTGGAGVAVVSRGKSAEQKQNAYTFLQWFLCSEEGARVQKEKNDFYTHVKKAYEDPEYKSFTHRLFGDTDVGPVWFDEMLKDISMRPTTPCDRFLYDARIQTAGLLVDESFSSAAAQWDKFKDLYNNMEPDILIK